MEIYIFTFIYWQWKNSQDYPLHSLDFTGLIYKSHFFWEIGIEKFIDLKKINIVSKDHRSNFQATACPKYKIFIPFFLNGTDDLGSMSRSKYSTTVLMSSLPLLSFWRHVIFFCITDKLRGPAKHQTFHSWKTYLQSFLTVVLLWQVFSMLLLLNSILKSDEYHYFPKCD